MANAGRDPQGGFAMEAFTVLLKSYENKRRFFSVFKVMKVKKKVILKLRRKW